MIFSSQHFKVSRIEKKQTFLLNFNRSSFFPLHKPTMDRDEISEDDECELNTISTGRYYCIDIYFLFIISCFISLTIFSGVLFIKATKKHVVLTHPISTVPCTTPSVFCQDRSCITKNTSSTLLIYVDLKKARFKQNRYEYYSSSYVSKSNGSIITFDFRSDSKAYLDNISFYDIRNEIELMNNGGFENGNLNSYCLCDPPNYRTEATETSAYKSRFGCEIYFRSSTMKFSQLVNTVVGRMYTVGFWYNGRCDLANEMRVYITPVYNQLTYETTFL